MCGIVGVINHPEASTLTYLGLYALQHRGQEGAGIVSTDGFKPYRHHGIGLINDIFNDRSIIKSLKGTAAIGHNRYSTTGIPKDANVQPLMFNFLGSFIAIAHNGNLVNLERLIKNLHDSGAIFQSTTDTEAIIHLLARTRGKTLEDRLLTTLRSIQGAYSLLFLTSERMIAARDPMGFRPLSIGNMGETTIIASESCAFDLIGAEYVRDVEPGELVSMNISGEIKSYQIAKPNPKFCIFEYVYFSRPDSLIYGENVDKTRRKLGKSLAVEKGIEDAEIVISVPDSSNTAAIGFSQRSDLRFEIGLIRNHYVGRTFIQPVQRKRDFFVRVKFNVVKGVLQGRKVVIVDDSIVRGTTMKKLVRMIRDAGAREIHVRISSPPIRNTCHYGMDFPSTDELIAHGKTIEEIREYIGADSLEYLSHEALLASTQKNPADFCTACFSGHYPIPIESVSGKNILEFTYEDINQ
jgi:amidophosphoribosyltransferase